MAPPDGVGAVLILQVVAPKALTIEVVGGQNTVAIVNDDPLAIRDGRWAGHVVEAVKLLFAPFCGVLLLKRHAPRRARAHLASPADGPRCLAEAMDQEVLAFL